MIIGGSASQKLAANVARELGDVLCPIETKKFPDGERYLRIKGEIDKEVIISSSFLWNEVYKNTRANTPWEKLRKNIFL